VQNIADGTTDAYVGSTGKVFFLLRNIKNEDRALRLVSIPYDKRLRDMYLPTTLTSEDYPNLLPQGEQVDTVATSVLLTAFNWPANSERYARVAKFVNAFFSKIDEFQKPPRHPKWRESSISIVVPGWTRFKAAQDWLDANNARNMTQADFVQFMERTGKSNVAPQEMDRLYREFLEWSKKRTP
jgi:hypothetical protein